MTLAFLKTGRTILIFMLGLISEQIAQLRMDRTEER